MNRRAMSWSQIGPMILVLVLVIVLILAFGSRIYAAGKGPIVGITDKALTALGLKNPAPATLGPVKDGYNSAIRLQAGTFPLQPTTIKDADYEKQTATRQLQPEKYTVIRSLPLRITFEKPFKDGNPLNDKGLPDVRLRYCTDTLGGGVFSSKHCTFRELSWCTDKDAAAYAGRTAFSSPKVPTTYELKDGTMFDVSTLAEGKTLGTFSLKPEPMITNTDKRLNSDVGDIHWMTFRKQGKLLVKFHDYFLNTETRWFDFEAWNNYGDMLQQRSVDCAVEDEGTTLVIKSLPEPGYYELTIPPDPRLVYVHEIEKGRERLSFNPLVLTFSYQP